MRHHFPPGRLEVVKAGGAGRTGPRRHPQRPCLTAGRAVPVRRRGPGGGARRGLRAPPRPPRVAAAAPAPAGAWGTRWRSRGGRLRPGQAAVQVLVSWSSLLTLGLKQSSWGPAPSSPALLLPFRFFFHFPPPSSPPPFPSLLVDFSWFSSLARFFFLCLLFPACLRMAVLLVNKISAARWGLISDPSDPG